MLNEEAPNTNLIVNGLTLDPNGYRTHDLSHSMRKLTITPTNGHMTVLYKTMCSNCIMSLFIHPCSTYWWYGYGVHLHLQLYVSYIVAVSFIGGGNQSTRGKPMTNYIT